MKHKTLGQVFTPKWIVDKILDLVGYNDSSIIEKYILEPSCGDGIFLLEIVNRYINISLEKGFSKEIITNNLGEYIVGIEIDNSEYKRSINNLDILIKEKLGEDYSVKWRIYNSSTLSLYKNYLGYFDFLVGNPPYVRIHNLDLDTRNLLKNEFQFSEGTIDLYLSFFEMGLKMLKSNGILGYISPNSYLQNSSYKLFREYIKTNKLLRTLIDFKSNKIFKGFSTYTAITILNKNNKNDSFEYNELIDGKIIKLNEIQFNKLGSNWSFSSRENDQFIEAISKNRNSFVKDYFDVQYGFATLRDKIFIGPAEEYNENLVFFNDELIEKSILRKIVKGSKFKGNIEKEKEFIIFPYFLIKNRYHPIKENDLKENFPYAYKYLVSEKDELIKRDLDKGALWYEFGRSQGIQTMHNEKIVISTLVNNNINFYRLPKDVFVYSGLFIIKNKPYSQWSQIEEILKSRDFFKYIRITGKDFSGGYKSITSKQIKDFYISHVETYSLFN